MKQWPGAMISTQVTSPGIPFGQYPTDTLTLETIVHTMVGDLHRIIEYPKLGFQIEQDVPEEVMEAFEELIKAGYTNHLIKS